MKTLAKRLVFDGLVLVTWLVVGVLFFMAWEALVMIIVAGMQA